MAETKPANKKKPEESSKGSAILINIFVGLALIVTIGVGFMLANGKIKLDFLFKESEVKKQERLKREADKFTADSLANLSEKSADFGIESSTGSDGNLSGSWKTPDSPDGNKHVIAGVFYNKMLCDRQSNKLRKLGLSPTVFTFESEGGNTFYRISVFSSPDLEEAKSKRDELNSSYGIETWVLK